jgi:hypothetical protein
VSRFDACDGEGEMPYELWRASVVRARAGRRGQAVLAEMEAALLALPAKRLIEGAVSRDGEVCAIGALAVHRRVTGGEQRAFVLAALEEAWRGYDDEHDCDADAIARYLGQDVLRVTYTLAWEIQAVNDRDWHRTAPTPEERYEWVLEWVRRHRRTEVPA